MSEKKLNENVLDLPKGPFMSRKTYEGKKDFDKYYLDVEEKIVFKDTGEVDLETGDKLGVSESKLVIKKIDIQERLNAEAKTVGVDAYVKALALQGEDISSYATEVGDKVQDFSNMPETLAETLTMGDKAKEAFAKLDPALKGNHTTLEGFLNSLTQESIDNFIKGRVAALVPEKEKAEESENK